MAVSDVMTECVFSGIYLDGSGFVVSSGYDAWSWYLTVVSLLSYGYDSDWASDACASCASGAEDLTDFASVAGGEPY